MNHLPEFRLLRPASAAGAVALRAEHPDSRFIAGGTDLLPNVRRGLVAPELLIDLSAVAELRRIESGSDALQLGAGVTLARIANDQRVIAEFPALAQAALAVAGPTHRTAATLGGNLCLDTRCQYYNQSEPWRESIKWCMKLAGDTCRVAPKSDRCYAAFSGDVAPALLALDATVELLGPGGPRTLPLSEFYVDDGMRWLALAPGEMLLAIHVPRAAGSAGGWRSAYDKVRVRGAIDFPLTGVAAALRRDGDALAGLRLACTGVSSRPEAIDGLDELLGQPLDAAAFALVEKRIKRCTQPMETTVTSVAYRRRATPVLARRLLQALWNAA